MLSFEVYLNETLITKAGIDQADSLMFLLNARKIKGTIDLHSSLQSINLNDGNPQANKWPIPKIQLGDVVMVKVVELSEDELDEPKKIQIPDG